MLTNEKLQMCKAQKHNNSNKHSLGKNWRCISASAGQQGQMPSQPRAWINSFLSWWVYSANRQTELQSFRAWVLEIPHNGPERKLSILRGHTTQENNTHSTVEEVLWFVKGCNPGCNGEKSILDVYCTVAYGYYFPVTLIGRYYHLPVVITVASVISCLITITYCNIRVFLWNPQVPVIFSASYTDHQVM